MADVKDKIMAIFGKGPVLASLATVTADNKPWVRYVMLSAGPDFAFNFATALGSRKVAQIKANPAVHALAGVGDFTQASAWVQIEGQAEINTDQAVKDAHWSEALKAYFKGPTDPDYCVITLKPQRIEYWSMTSMEPQVWQA